MFLDQFLFDLSCKTTETRKHTYARCNVAGVLCRKKLDAMSVVDISDIESNGHIFAVLGR